MNKTLFALVFILLSCGAFAARDKDKIVCAIRTNGVDMFFSVYEKKSDRLLIGFAGEPLESADDEFKLRLHDSDGASLHFRPEHFNDYPGYFDLHLDRKNMIQSGKLVSDGLEMDVVGNCLAI